jgi:ornithine cyclodeaminase
MHLISAAEISSLLPMSRAVSLMREAFQMISRHQASLAPRQTLEVSSGTGLLMGAAHDEQGIVGKLVSVMPSNLSKGLPGSIGLVLLMDSDTGEPLALMDGTRLTAIRTAALNACAVDLLAKPDSRVALIIGCGTQASAQLSGLQAVRELVQIRVMGRNQEQTDAFVRLHREAISVELISVEDPARALDGVDIVVSATNSPDPVVPGVLIPNGCHVSGIGSFKREMCEYDIDLISKASIFVESRQTASVEAGELIKGIETGVTCQGDWTELGEVLMGVRPGRRRQDEITFFKSVGHAVFDLFGARAIWQMAMERSGGTQWWP